jgi:hypothetical protein
MLIISISGMEEEGRAAKALHDEGFEARPNDLCRPGVDFLKVFSSSLNIK